jgi:hypothetical protein
VRGGMGHQCVTVGLRARDSNSVYCDAVLADRSRMHFNHIKRRPPVAPRSSGQGPPRRSAARSLLYSRRPGRSCRGRQSSAAVPSKLHTALLGSRKSRLCPSRDHGRAF